LGSDIADQCDEADKKPNESRLCAYEDQQKPTNDEKGEQ
jgi:hypothetical protein